MAVVKTQPAAPVVPNAADAAPPDVGTQALGSSAEFAREDHTHGIADNSVTNAKLRDSAGLSVIGRSGSASGDPADIVASADGQVFRRSGTTVGWGQVATTGLTNLAVTTGKLAQNAVDNAKAADMVQATIKGRAAGAGTGDPTDLTPTQVRTIVGGFSTMFPDGAEIPFTILSAGSTSTATFAHGLSIDATRPVMVFASLYNAGVGLHAMAPGLISGFGPLTTLTIFRLGTNIEFRASQDLSASWTAIALVGYTAL